MNSIALAFELLPPTRVCALFSRALNRPVSYQPCQSIDIEVPIPNGYREQLQGLEIIFGKNNAPYFGADLDPHGGCLGNGVGKGNVHIKGSKHSEGSGEDVEGVGDGTGTVVEEARALWGGWRGVEEYAREVFPVEESNNGMTWMREGEN